MKSFFVSINIMLQKKGIQKSLFFALLISLQWGCSTFNVNNEHRDRGDGIEKSERRSTPTSPNSSSPIPSSPDTSNSNQTREESPRTDSPSPSMPSASPSNGSPSLKIPSIPRVGIILGPGGSRTYAHIGFLRQMQKHRWNIQAIVGIEMAAPIAALYAQKEQVNQVEWQYFKIKDDDILGSKEYKGKSVAMNEFAEQLKAMFQNLQTRDLKVPFGCPALNLATGKEYLMSRGIVSNLVELCTPYPPLFTPYKRNISGLRDLKSSIDFLHQQGANFIILVNAISEGNRREFYKSRSDSMEQILWNELSLKYSRSIPGVDTIINLDLDKADLSDFSNKKYLIEAGEKACERDMKSLTHRLGF